jgi:hypothetical protein
MTEDPKRKIDIQFDPIPNILRIAPKSSEELKKRFLGIFESNLEGIFLRYKELPDLFLPKGKYSDMLIEARFLYVLELYYSCVAMCGITAERIAKDILNNSVFFRDKSGELDTKEDTKNILERVDMETIRELLIKSNIIDGKLRKPIQKLFKLRNAYVHSKGLKPKEDSKKAIQHLHTIIDETFSLYPDELKNNG